MKRTAIVFILSFTALSLFAGDDHKSCDMKGSHGKAVSVTGKVTCKTDSDCSLHAAGGKQSYTICEFSKADLPKLSASGAMVKVSGKLITCEGAQKLQIEHVASN